MLSRSAHRSVLILAALLSACGGGGGSGSGSSTPGGPTGLTYGENLFVVLLGAEIEPLVPAVQGVVTTWTITPAALPPGLGFDAASGRISGTPSTLTARETFKIEAGNANGSTSIEIDLRVAEPANFLHVAQSDGTLSTLVVDVVRGEVDSFGYQADPAGFPVPERAVAHPSGKALYVPNLGNALNDSNISTFGIDSRGQLTPLTPAPVGPGPHDFVLRSDGAAAYAVCRGSDELLAYKVDPVTLELNGFVGNPQVIVGDQPIALAIDPLNAIAYVANEASTDITLVHLDRVSGEPTGATSTFFLNNGKPGDLAIDPTGRLLFVTLINFKLVLATIIDQNTGHLTVVGSAPTGNTPRAIAVHPDGDYLLVVNEGDDSISAYEVDPATGKMTAGGPALVVGGDPTDLRIEDSGKSAFLCCRSASEIVTLDLADRLNPTVAWRTRTRKSPLALGVLGGGRPIRLQAERLYALNIGDASISSYAVEPNTGALTESGPAVLTGPQPTAMALDPLGRFLWAASAGDDGVQAYKVDEVTGVPTASGSVTATDADPAGLAVDPAGRVLFVTSAVTDQLTSFAIHQGNGTLTPVDLVTTTVDPGTISVDPTGQLVATGDQGSGFVSAFRFDLAGNFVEHLSGDFGPGDPSGLHWNRAGDRLYVALPATDLVMHYDLNAQTLDLTLINPGAPAEDPLAIVPHPSLQRAYSPISDPAFEGLQSFALAEDGTPTSEGLLTGVGLLPVDLVIDPAGRFLITANLGGDNLSRFTLDAAGAPTFAGMTPAGNDPFELVLLRKAK